MDRTRTIFSKCLFVVANVAVIFCAHTAAAQSTSAPVTYCKQSSLTGPKFVQIIHAIIAHGDIADVAFIEKMIGAKLSQTTDHTGYQSNNILGAPVEVKLYSPNQIVIFSPGPQSHENFISDCLGLRLSNFTNSYGMPDRWLNPNIGYVGGDMYFAPPKDDYPDGAQWFFSGTQTSHLYLTIGFVVPHSASTDYRVALVRIYQR